MEEDTVGGSVDGNIQEELMEGGQESWKQPKSEANKELRDVKEWPNEMNSGNVQQLDEKKKKKNLKKNNLQRCI